jgi:hypothetical protein
MNVGTLLMENNKSNTSSMVLLVRLFFGWCITFAPLSAISFCSYAADNTYMQLHVNQLTIYHGQGVDSNLLELPKQILTADLPFESAYFEGIGYTHYLSTPAWLSSGLSLLRLDDVSTALELLGIQHRGLQNHFELDAVYMLRSDEGQLGPLRIRVGAGIGLSNAFGRPDYEDGPLEGDRNRRYRFQSYETIEIEAGAASVKNISLVGRIHHRSGLYGLIAPKNVGSNFMTIGLRFDMP